MVARRSVARNGLSDGMSHWSMSESTFNADMGLSLPIYSTSTLLGMIPSTFFLTYMGAAFQVGKLLGIALLVIFLILLIGLPWGIRRYNWFGLQDIIRIE